MVPTEHFQTDPIALSQRGSKSVVVAPRSGLYILFVLAVVLGAGAYSLRTYGIFSCQASNYSSDRYLSYCNATSYGDYDHGAIWFGLEPAANAAAARARVLFLGDSHTQFAFSSNATADWFSSLSETYYLLGFSHEENYTFEGPLLGKLHPKAKVYVINVDSFFARSETAPGKTVMRDESARTLYEEKRKWQSIHKAVCTTFEAVCAHDEAIFRARSTGAWLVSNNKFPNKPVSYDNHIDQNVLASYTTLGNEFLAGLHADRACSILTIVPTVKTSIGTAKAIARAMGLNLVAPRLEGLVTFDQVHLDPKSAERWSAAFFEEAGPQIRNCLDESLESRVAYMHRASAVNH